MSFICLSNPGLVRTLAFLTSAGVSSMYKLRDIFLTRGLEEFEVVNGERGRRCLSSKLERVIEEDIMGRMSGEGVGISSRRFSSRMTNYCTIYIL